MLVNGLSIKPWPHYEFLIGVGTGEVKLFYLFLVKEITQRKIL